MSLVILLETPTEKEARRILSIKPSKIICKNLKELPEALSKVKSYEHNLEQEEVTELTNKSFDDVINFGHQPIASKNVADWLLVKNHSLWYNIRLIFYNHYKKNVIDEAYINTAMKYAEQDHKVFVFPNDGMEIFDFEKTSYFGGFIEKTKSYKASVAKAKFALLFSIRALLGVVQFLKFSRKRSYHIIITHPLYRQQIHSRMQRKSIMGDPHIENLLERAMEDPDFLFLSECHPPRLNDPSKFQINSDSIFYHYKKSLFIETFMALSIFLGKHTNSKKYIQKHLSDFEKKLYGQQGKLTHILFKLLPLIRFVLVYQSAAEILLKYFKVKTITTTNEHGSNNKAILNVARDKGVKTIGVQHGTVYSKHIEYYFSEADMNYKPIPDLTITWGLRWNDILSKSSNYPAHSLTSLGQLRTDGIYDLKEKTHKSNKKQQKRVLYASQPLFQGEEHIREKYAQDFFELTKTFPDVHFMIKPHPRERDYQDFFEGLSSKMGATNFEYFTGDLYEILSDTDIAIVYYSTVGDEAIYFDIPLLVLDYYRQDFAGYVENQVGLPCFNYSELEDNLRIAINSPFTAVKNYGSYKDSNVFKIDGNTSERYYEFIVSQKVSNRIL